MTYAAVSITADELLHRDDTGGTDCDGLERIHVSLAGEARTNGDEDAGAEYRCKVCGEALEAFSITHGTASAEGWTAVGGGAACDANGYDYHEAERVPLSWANSAAITLDEKDDAIHVSISTGDPRGAFVFTVRRRPGEGDLLLHVPHPTEPMSHEKLTELHSGTYQIG